ncbi:unnamed protein product [Tilletia controversa]|nr:unnamed protein product [Tilletia controversa]
MPAERTRRARLAKGSKYKDLQEFKDAVRDYALEEAFELKVQKSNSKWAILVCKNKECPFRARAHVCKDDPGTVEVSVFVPGHVCAGLAASERDSTNKHSYLVDLMRVFYERKQEAAIWMQILAPHPHELFVAALQRARKMTCIPADNLSGLVIGETGDQYEVDLAADPKTQLSFCPCGVPSLMLLPCAHLCALALTLKVAPVIYAYGYWTRATWRATYSKAYVAVSTDGLTSNNVEVPSAKTKKGRPQKARKEAGQGPSLTPSSSKNTSPSVSFCSSCGEPDHTARHCKAYYEAALH